MTSRPWQAFRVGAPSTRASCVEPDCQPLGELAHVAHVPTALRIVEDRMLRADLVFDESKLKTERIRVVWFSPNDWSHGFRYGNVRFRLDWATLIQGRRYYWVESIAYGVAACRILVTDVDRSGQLEAYEPGTGDGPWWRDRNGNHFWNGKFCLEVMFEGDVDLGRITAVDFVDHHPFGCSIDPNSCPYRKSRRDAAGAEFLAALASRAMTIELPGLLADSAGVPTPSWALVGAMSHILGTCVRAAGGVWGDVNAVAPHAPALARAVLGTLGNSAVPSDLTAIVRLFASEEELAGALTDAIAAAVGLPDSALLRPDPPLF